MRDVHYHHSCHDLAAEHLNGFFVGWPDPPDPATHLRILRHSDAIVVARDIATGQVVGFVTAITDHVSCAYIPHLEVLPMWQGQGIGSELVDRLVTRLQDLYMIDLVCDDDVRPFYERIGFRPVVGMVRRNYASQSGIETLDLHSPK